MTISRRRFFAYLAPLLSVAGGWTGIAPSRSLSASTFAKRVESDFEAGRVAIVDGWVLSQTEARALKFYRSA